MNPTKIGLIGVGNISPAYIDGCRVFDHLDVAACADLNMERARSIASEYNIPRAVTVEELLADPDIEIVLNLTVPAVHAEVTQQILRAGKHVWSEKPLAVTLEEANRIRELAAATSKRVGCAPDTHLHAEYQMLRKLLDDGAIGTPVAASIFFGTRGPEGWHPNPDFYFQRGGGPLLDMGPYYIASLIMLLGSVVQVTAMTSISFPERIAKDGHLIPVAVPTHVTGALQFESGVIATLITSFDMTAHQLPRTEIYGSSSTLWMPNPPWGDEQTITMFVPEQEVWQPQPTVFNPHWRRGIGVADMALAIRNQRPHRASLEMAYHTLEIMNALIESGETRRFVDIESRCERPAPLPVPADGVEGMHD